MLVKSRCSDDAGAIVTKADDRRNGIACWQDRSRLPDPDDARE
jgi:hypothetical protein